MRIFSKDELNEKTVVELRELSRANGIAGMSKVRKDEIITELSKFYKKEARKAQKETEEDNSQDSTNREESGPMPYLNSSMHTFLKEDNTYETLVNVSCGAASSNFPVVGKTVGEVRDFYREILNIGFDAKAILNGDKEVDNSIVLKNGDNLEFIRPAGVKG